MTQSGCTECRTDRSMWRLIAGPAALAPISGVAYAITGDWAIGPLGAGVAFAVAATVAVLARRWLP